MASGLLRSALITVLASLSVASAAPGLSLTISGPGGVTDVNHLKVVATLTNTGDETLRLLNDPLSPLSRLPANTFAISNPNGAAPAFVGIRAKYVPEAAIAIGNNAITTLVAGKSISVEHNLGEAYNFTSAGEGAYSIEARNLFYMVSADNNALPIYASHAQAHVTKISGSLAAVRTRTLNRRASFVGCSSSQQSQLVSVASQAQSYASSAASYAQSFSSSTNRYNTWFGTYTDARHSTITSHFTRINSHDISSYTFDCTCSEPGAFSFVDPDQFGYVTLCNAFWQSPATGTDSQAGTLVHESSHFTINGATDDYAYGQSFCQSLAQSDPGTAIKNADSHEYFAENNPSLS